MSIPTPPSVDKLTLDYCHVLDYFIERRPKRELVQAAVWDIFTLAEKRLVDLAITEYVRDELGGNPEAAAWLAKLAELGVAELPQPAEPGRWRLGKHPLASSDFSNWYLTARTLVERQLGTNKRGRYIDTSDWGHLQAHLLSRRDIFITTDEGILVLRDELGRRFQLEVMCPQEYLHKREARGALDDSAAGTVGL